MKGLEALLKTHLDPRSRSPSPVEPNRGRFPSPQDRYRDPSPYRGHIDFERGRPTQRYERTNVTRGRGPVRYERSDRLTYRQSPDRSRFQKPYPQRLYSSSSRREGLDSNDYRAGDWHEDRFRSPPRDRYWSPEWGYRGSPRRFQDYDNGQPRREFHVRFTSPSRK